MQRVVVTGLGVVTPIGTGLEEFWSASLAGRVGTGPVEEFSREGVMSDRAGVVRDFDARDHIRKVDRNSLSRSVQFAVAAARIARDDAGLDADGEAAGTCYGTVVGNRPAYETSRGGPEPNWYDGSLVARAPAQELGFTGPAVTLPTACAAGNSAISHSFDVIASGRRDVMLAGGADEVSKAMHMMFNSFRALAPDVVRPFSLNRKGLILGEGAGALVLESLDRARARGARVYGEVLGHGNYADGYHMTAPHPRGIGAVKSMEAALRMARVDASSVDFVSAHGTGTPSNDVVEATAIREVLGDHSERVAVSSTKSVLGHPQGAASAIEAVTCLLAIRDQVVPPTANFEAPDPECALPIVVGAPQERKVRIALNNAFGFGGNISCVVFGPPPADG